MNIFVAALGTLLAILGLLCAAGALAGRDKPMRKVYGAAGAVLLAAGGTCFLSLI